MKIEACTKMNKQEVIDYLKNVSANEYAKIINEVSADKHVFRTIGAAFAVTVVISWIVITAGAWLDNSPEQSFVDTMSMQ